MSSILVPFDASPHAYKALHIAIDLSEKYKASLALVHVAGLEKTEQNSARAKAVVAAANKKLQHRSVKPSDIAVVYGDPAECILLAAKRMKVSTIVMGCRGVVPGDPAHGENIMFGSVSQTVFRRAECTCISVK